MSYTQQHSTGFCTHCERRTAHTLDVYNMEHAAHWLVVLLLCGTYLPLYLILVFINETGNYFRPYRCAHCGTAATKRNYNEYDSRRQEQ